MWKRTNSGKRYRDLPHEERQSIRSACIEEQYGLCAWCCQRITLSNSSSHNEHVDSQDLAPNRTLDFANIVASCNKLGQCGKAHGSKPLPLTALMIECETELKFYLSGRVEGTTLRAKASIEALNLGSTRQQNKALFYNRKQMVDLLIFDQGLQPETLIDEDDDLLEALSNELQQPNELGRLQPFAPILVNVICQLKTPPTPS
nr:TIGR02646 family protein [Pseudomonas nunensis]